MPTDVADADQVEAAAAAVEERLRADRRLGQRRHGDRSSPALPSIDADEFRRVTEVTYLGSVYGTMAALGGCSPRDHGTIVQVGSALSYRAIPLQAAYCGAKFAIRGFTDSIRTELLARPQPTSGSRWSSCPASTRPSSTGAAPSCPSTRSRCRRSTSPRSPAEAVYWAAQHRRRELWVGGSTVLAIVGNKLAPRLADRYLARTGDDGQQIDDCRSPRTAPTTSSSPSPDQAATHGIFDAQAKHAAARSYGPRPTDRPSPARWRAGAARSPALRAATSERPPR